MESSTRSGVAGGNVRVLIIQPFIPSYRVELFRQLHQRLDHYGIESAVAAALPHADDAVRDDDQTVSSADFLLPERHVQFAGRRVARRLVQDAFAQFEPGMVIVEQAIKNLETWELMLGQRFSGRPRVALWGQGRSYSRHPSRVMTWSKTALTNRADWFFAYTTAGRNYVVESGFPLSRTTVLNNSTDTARLTTELAAVSEDSLANFQRQHGLTPGATGLFLGGVDERKGIRFLLETVTVLRQMVPGFTLLVGGAGSSARLVREAQESGLPVRYLGRIEGRDKALALVVSDLLMIPEWIGLVAVDAITAGKPVVSTKHPSHSPEFEYLVDAGTLVLAEHTPYQYAQSVASVVEELDAWSAKANQARDRSALSVESMANNFATGIRQWSESLGKRP